MNSRGLSEVRPGDSVVFLTVGQAERRDLLNRSADRTARQGVVREAVYKGVDAAER